MVLKYKTDRTHYVGNGEAGYIVDQWNFIDGIIGANIYYDEDIKTTVASIEFETRSPMSIALHNEAYLLNENGKTIEKVRA